MFYFNVYVIVINLVGFIQMGIDKQRAKKRAWRIPESQLFLVSLFFGAIGSFLGMRFFRHKTKHPTFKYGLPILVIIQLVIIYFIVEKLG